jgi:bacterial/archaeal transporter family protein
MASMTKVGWFPLALAAAGLYGLHNVFTRAASGRISDGMGGLVLEGTAALVIAAYVIGVTVRGVETTQLTQAGVGWSMAAGLCVGAGTVLYFMIFRGGGELSAAAPTVLAGGSALMVLAGWVIYREPVTLPRLVGVGLTVAGIALLRK